MYKLQPHWTNHTHWGDITEWVLAWFVGDATIRTRMLEQSMASTPDEAWRISLPCLACAAPSMGWTNTFQTCWGHPPT